MTLISSEMYTVYHRHNLYMYYQMSISLNYDRIANIEIDTLQKNSVSENNYIKLNVLLKC